MPLKPLTKRPVADSGLCRGLGGEQDVLLSADELRETLCSEAQAVEWVRLSGMKS